MTWPSTRLKNVARVSISNVDKKTVAGEPEVQLCNYVDVYKNDAITPDIGLMRATASVDQVRTFRVLAGDTLITKDSETADDIAVPAFVAESTPGMVCGYHLALVRPSQDMHPKYLYWALASLGFQSQMTALATGVTRFGLRQQVIGNGTIPRPPMEEQRRIADFLDVETARIDRMGNLKEDLRRRLDERAVALLNLAIDDLTSRFGTLPLRRFILGVDQGTSPQCDAVPANEDEWGVLKVSCLRPGMFLQDENKRLPAGTQPNTRHEVREGDLLVTRANTPELVGSTAVVSTIRRKLLLSDKIFRIKTTPDIDPRYVAVVASGSRVRALCAASSNGASQSMANIRFEEVKAWPIPAASPSDQAEIVSRVESSQRAVSQLRARISSQLDLLSERRQALVTAAVTGEFDVSSASNTGVVN